MKKTAVAPSNIAFVKYWGKKDEQLRIPTHSNISMNLSGLLTTTTVELSDAFFRDEVIIDGHQNEKETQRVVKQLDRIRNVAHIETRAKVVSRNNFPSSTGLSSSASGFAALTVAASAAARLNLNEKELSILARLGSGSACRSIPDGFVEWKEGVDTNSSYAVSLFPPHYWDIVDVVAIVSDEKKDIPTSAGHKLASTSPFYETRLAGISKKIDLCKRLMAAKDFPAFGELVEREALEMHAVMITSLPSLIYWLPNTVVLMKKVQQWRRNGLEVYFTINTGQDVHVICQKKDTEKVSKLLEDIPQVKKIIVNYPGKGTYLTDKHLF